MRFTSLIASLVLALTVVTANAAASYGLVASPSQACSGNPCNGASRPAFTAKSNAGVAIGQNDTLMVALTGSDTAGQSRNRYTPLNPGAFWSQVPTNYEYVSANKDSLILFVTAIRVDADTGDVTVLLQGLAYGDTAVTGYASRGTYVTLGSTNLPNSAALSRARISFPNPGLLKFRVRLTGATATDTTRVFRAEIYDK